MNKNVLFYLNIFFFEIKLVLFAAELCQAEFLFYLKHDMQYLNLQKQTETNK